MKDPLPTRQTASPEAQDIIATSVKAEPNDCHSDIRNDSNWFPDDPVDDHTTDTVIDASGTLDSPRVTEQSGLGRVRPGIK